MLKVKVKKNFGELPAYGQLNVDFVLEEQSLTAILGPSGSGISTLLIFIAGFRRPGTGHIAFGQKVWVDTHRKIFLPPQYRQVGMVFQDYALFPNMTVKQNLLYALEKGKSKSAVEEMLSVMELKRLSDQYPVFLSGGQQQRLALARALIAKPKILLLDEPLSALDTKNRIHLQNFVRYFKEKHELTVLLVTHNLSEVLKLADRIITLDRGVVIEDSPIDVFFKNSHNSPNLIGEIIRIELQNDVTAKITVLLGENLFVFDTSVLNPKWQIGQKIEMIVRDNRLALR